MDIWITLKYLHVGVCTDTTLTVLDYEVFGDAQGYHIQLATESIFILASMKLQSGKYAKKSFLAYSLIYGSCISW